MNRFLNSVLAHPLTKALDIDDPRTTELRVEIVKRKPFLQKIYNDWYRMIRSRIPPGPGGVLEIGSGAGYLHRFVPAVIRSEVFLCCGVHLVADARSLPIASRSLKSIVMTDVFHHIPDVSAFLSEAARCLRPGGRIIMIEPWVTSWSKFVFTRFHYEPFVPNAETWEIPSNGPLSGANGALPWMVFIRDRSHFNAAFPMLDVAEIRPMMPFKYLVSGGISLRSLMPGISYFVWDCLERALAPWNHRLAMFALLDLVRLEEPLQSRQLIRQPASIYSRS